MADCCDGVTPCMGCCRMRRERRSSTSRSLEVKAALAAESLSAAASVKRVATRQTVSSTTCETHCPCPEVNELLPTGPPMTITWNQS